MKSIDASRQKGGVGAYFQNVCKRMGKYVLSIFLGDFQRHKVFHLGRYLLSTADSPLP